MGLFYQHNINATTKIAIWRIEEHDEYFLSHIPLKREVTHPYKRLQHLAGRFLLPRLFPDFPLKSILIADTRKPYLEDEQYHFNISHCGNFAAAIASTQERVGIDIELVTSRILQIAPKFLNANEEMFLKEWQHLPGLYKELVTVIWSAKEAIFKWYGNGGVDFKNHMQLQDAIIFRANEWMDMRFVFSKEHMQELKVRARIFDGLVLAYVHTGAKP